VNLLFTLFLLFNLQRNNLFGTQRSFRAFTTDEIFSFAINIFIATLPILFYD